MMMRHLIAIALALLASTAQAQTINVSDIAAHGGTLYIADSNASRIYAHDAAGLRVVAGNGTWGFSGDGGPATQAQLGTVHAVTAHQTGLYLCDGQRVRKISGGIITTIAGSGLYGYSHPTWGGDGGPALSGTWKFCRGLAVDSSGAVYLADSDGWTVRRIADGIITRAAGSGIRGSSGNGGPALSATFLLPISVAAWGSELSVLDTNAHSVRWVNIEPVSGAIGQINALVGDGLPGFSGDGGPAASARLFYPWDVAYDASGQLYIADKNNHRVRRVARTNVISTFAGTGTAGQTGDGGPASGATLSFPEFVTADTTTGDVYVSNRGTAAVIRRINAAGIISRVTLSGPPPTAPPATATAVPPTAVPPTATRTTQPTVTPSNTPQHTATPGVPPICADLHAASHAIDAARVKAGCP